MHPKVLEKTAGAVIFIGSGVSVVGWIYVAWLFWTDPTWVWAKVAGLPIVLGLVVAGTAAAILDWADRIGDD